MTVSLGPHFELEVLLVQEMRKLSILDSHQYGSIAESSIRSGSLDLSQEIGSFDPDGGPEVTRQRSSLWPRFGSSVCEDVFSVQMSVYRTDASKELIARKSADLEEMIAMSVFNAL
jgi:hypothetical protein